MSEPYRVQGSTILSKLDFSAETQGEEAKRQLEAYLESAGVSQVLDADWYPFALYDGVLRRLAADHFSGNLSRLREVGVYSAGKALGNTYAAYAARRDFPLFLQRISSLHGRFYSAGRLAVTATGDDFCELELTGAPEISYADVYIAAGFYIGAARLMGLEQARCRFQVGDTRVHYRLDWS